MPVLAQVNSLFRNFFRKPQIEKDLDDEINAHLELLTDQNINEGVNPQDARRAARIELGGVEQLKENVRAVRAGVWLETLWQDLRFGVRMLRKNPGVTAVVILALALGIGSNTAIFSVVNTVLLKPLDAPEADRLVQFLTTDNGVSSAFTGPLEFNVWRQQTSAFEYVSAYRLELVNLTSDPEPEQVPVARVSADFFGLFGAPVLQGRIFSNYEDRPRGGKVALLSYGFWQRHFGSDPHVLGKTIILGNNSYPIIGVLGPNFNTEQFDQLPDVWVPFQIDPTATTDRSGYCYVAGRLKPGVTPSRAIAELQSVAADYRHTHPGIGSAQSGFTVQPLRDVMVGNVRPSLMLLAGAVSLVLLIACANVANLLLLRASARKGEIATRVALGSGRWRIVRQMLTESLLLSLSGGVLGLLLGLIGVRALLAQYHSNFSLSLNPIHIPRIGDAGSAVTLDWRVLGFTALVSLLTGVLFGALPALRASLADVSALLRERAGRSGIGVRQNKARSLLMISEISLALILLVGSALLIRTFIALRLVDPGFESHNVLTMQMSVTGTRFEKTADLDKLVRGGVERISALPGIVAASSACCVPLDTVWQLPFIIRGRPLAGKYHGFAGWTFISPDYFKTLNVPLLRGRAFTEHDDASAPGVVIINQAMAKRFWPNEDPLNNSLMIGRGMRPDYDNDPIRQIVGIVGNVRDVSLNRTPRPAMYVPIAQLPDSVNIINLRQLPIAWFIRTSVEPHRLGPAIEAELREASGGLPGAYLRSMKDVEAQSTTRAQFNMLLMTIFGGSALLLAAIGIYGLTAYAVQQRTHEIGIRMALGAQRSAVLRMVIRDAAKLALIGVCIGLLGALALTRFLSNQLFGVGPTDLFTLAAVTVLLSIVALVASYIPARRATKVDPMVALRYE